jgi:hypothetical protein
MLPTSGKNAVGLYIVAHAQTQDVGILPTSVTSVLGQLLVAHGSRSMYQC